MQITTNKTDNTLEILVSGRLDTTSSPELDACIAENAQGITELVLNLKDMPYTSSAGLRVMLKAQKLMNQQGSMKVINVQPDVMEIFDMTGFADILTIE